MATTNTFGGVYRGTSQGNSYVPQYKNLPSGIYNAGAGNESAYVGEVQPDSLVSNQLAGLLGSNSPYMQQARQSGMQVANARGMLNSSMAAGNSQAAAIQAGMPIAQADASAYQQQQLSNQQYLNQILQQRMSNQAQLNAANASAAGAYAAAELQARAALARQREQLAYSGEQAELDRNFQSFFSQQGYGQQLGLANQAYQHGLGRDAFNLANNMTAANMGFRYNMGLQAMNNPYMLQNPEAFGGYMDWIGGDYSNSIRSLIGYAFGRGG